MGAAANLGSGHDPFVTDIHAVGKLLHSKSMFTPAIRVFFSYSFFQENQVNLDKTARPAHHWRLIQSKLC